MLPEMAAQSTLKHFPINSMQGKQSKGGLFPVPLSLGDTLPVHSSPSQLLAPQEGRVCAATALAAAAYAPGLDPSSPC